MNEAFERWWAVQLDARDFGTNGERICKSVAQVAWNAARLDALEQAAQRCDNYAKEATLAGFVDNAEILQLAAQAIRSLKGV